MFVVQQFEKEAHQRIKFYEDNKAGREYQTKSYAVGLPSIDPMQFALKKKREEDETIRQIIEEARAKQVKEVMYPVDAVTKQKLYDGLSVNRAGRYAYMAERKNFSPEHKFTFPLLSSWHYGWKMNEHADLYGRAKYARTEKIQESFYSRNGVPLLKDPVATPYESCK